MNEEVLMDWLKNNWAEVGFIFLGIIQIAEIVVQWTKTPKDDAIVAKIKQIITSLFGTKKKLKTKPPLLVRLALRAANKGKIPFWLKCLLYLRLGIFRTPANKAYLGFLIKWKF